MIVLNDSDNDDETIGFISKSKKKNSIGLCVNIKNILVTFLFLLLVYTFFVKNCYYTMNPPPMNPPPMNPPPMNINPVFISPYPLIMNTNTDLSTYPPSLNIYTDLSPYPPPLNIYTDSIPYPSPP